MFEYESIKDTFCAVPWSQILVQNDGNLMLCCMSGLYLPKDNEMGGLNVSDLDNIDFVMNSNTLKEIRLSMLGGKWHKVCCKCREMEKPGTMSDRNLYNYDFKEDIPRILEATRNDGTIELKTLSLDLRLGNTCNLKCRICFPYNSVNLLDDFEKLFPEDQEYLKDMRRFKEIKWQNDPAIWKKLQGLIPYIKYLKLMGGEPMIIHGMIDFLKECVETGHSHDIVVRYTTNLTVIPHDIEKLWREFSKIQVIGSIDAYGELNSYIRYPSKWEAINSTMKKLDRYHKEYNIEWVCVNATVQIYNIFYLDELTHYLTSEFDFIDPVPKLSHLDVPSYLSCKILPIKMKEEAKNSLLQIKDKYCNKVPESSRIWFDRFDWIIEFMYSEQNDNLIPTFIDMNSKWDKLRNQDVLKVAPKLKDLFLFST